MCRDGRVIERKPRNIHLENRVQPRPGAKRTKHADRIKIYLVKRDGVGIDQTVEPKCGSVRSQRFQSGSVGIIGQMRAGEQAGRHE